MAVRVRSQRKSELELFVCREEEIKKLEEAYKAVLRDLEDSRKWEYPEPHLVCFNGDGANGKTLLVRYFKKDKYEDRYVTLDLSNDNYDSVKIIDCLMNLITQNIKGFSFPRTKAAIMSINREKGLISYNTDKSKDSLEIPQSVTDCVLGLIEKLYPDFKNVKALFNLAKTSIELVDFANSALRKCISDTRAICSIGDLGKLTDNLHVYFSEDLDDNIKKLKKPIIINLDSYEAYVDKLNRSSFNGSNDRWLVELIEGTNGILWVINCRFDLKKKSDYWKNLIMYCDREIKVFNSSEQDVFLDVAGIKDEYRDIIKKNSQGNPWLMYQYYTLLNGLSSSENQNLIAALKEYNESNSLLKRLIFGQFEAGLGIKDQIGYEKLLIALAFLPEGWTEEELESCYAYDPVCYDDIRRTVALTESDDGVTRMNQKLRKILLEDVDENIISNIYDSYCRFLIDVRDNNKLGRYLNTALHIAVSQRKEDIEMFLAKVMSKIRRICHSSDKASISAFVDTLLSYAAEKSSCHIATIAVAISVYAGNYEISNLCRNFSTEYSFNAEDMTTKDYSAEILAFIKVAYCKFITQDEKKSLEYIYQTTRLSSIEELVRRTYEDLKNYENIDYGYFYELVSLLVSYYGRMSDFHKAFECSLECMALLDSDNGSIPAIEKVRNRFDIAELSMKLGRYEETISYCLEALDILRNNELADVELEKRIQVLKRMASALRTATIDDETIAYLKEEGGTVLIDRFYVDMLENYAEKLFDIADADSNVKLLECVRDLRIRQFDSEDHFKVVKIEKQLVIALQLDNRIQEAEELSNEIWRKIGTIDQEFSSNDENPLHPIVEQDCYSLVEELEHYSNEYPESIRGYLYANQFPDDAFDMYTKSVKSYVSKNLVFLSIIERSLLTGYLYDIEHYSEYIRYVDPVTYMPMYRELSKEHQALSLQFEENYGLYLLCLEKYEEALDIFEKILEIRGEGDTVETVRVEYYISKSLRNNTRWLKRENDPVAESEYDSKYNDFVSRYPDLEGNSNIRLLIYDDYVYRHSKRIPYCPNSIAMDCRRHIAEDLQLMGLTEEARAVYWDQYETYGNDDPSDVKAVDSLFQRARILHDDDPRKVSEYIDLLELTRNYEWPFMEYAVNIACDLIRTYYNNHQYDKAIDLYSGILQKKVEMKLNSTNEFSEEIYRRELLLITEELFNELENNLIPYLSNLYENHDFYEHKWNMAFKLIFETSNIYAYIIKLYFQSYEKYDDDGEIMDVTPSEARERSYSEIRNLKNIINPFEDRLSADSIAVKILEGDTYRVLDNPELDKARICYDEAYGLCKEVIESSEDKQSLKFKYEGCLSFPAFDYETCKCIERPSWYGFDGDNNVRQCSWKIEYSSTKVRYFYKWYCEKYGKS